MRGKYIFTVTLKVAADHPQEVWGLWTERTPPDTAEIIECVSREKYLELHAGDAIPDRRGDLDF